MANWYGTCRSNYFRVKDVDAFTAMLGEFEATLITDSEGRVGFVSDNEFGGVPQTWPDDQEEPVSILDEIAEHLVENSVCVIIEAGAEKARYVTGRAVAIASTGEQTVIALDDIYAQAQTEFGGDAEITVAIY
jgi:hypothetical protein